MESSNDSVVGSLPVHGDSFRLRSYQAEMVEESLHANIIVVMDTGSGKTHVAIERTRAELEMCKPNKVVWFLAPTVTLCEQQYEAFRSHLPGYGIQVLSGQDGIDHWTDQTTWDAVLHNVRIVLSTHQVLLDALTHAFVRMSDIALLIFDEAHHCTLKHPANRIMSDFYKPNAAVKDSCEPVTKILGLSASPVKKAAATTQALEEIEHNLQATARTPKMHRSELMRFVHNPDIEQISYPTTTTSNMGSPLLVALQRAHAGYDIKTDPYMLDLLRKRNAGYDVTRELEKLFTSIKTYCSEELKILACRAKDMADELGVCAMEWYLHQCVEQFQKTVQVFSDDCLFDLSVHEKKHLLGILKSLPLSHDNLNRPMSLSKLSRKVEVLVEILVTESKDNPHFTGLVFVEQRVWVATLAHILASHPRTKNTFTVSTFIGTSGSNKRPMNVANFAEARNQQMALEDFRAGRTNLMLATSVLEEGIDISNCHLVICFERPKNLKSFVQRRGRARKKGSKYLIFTPQGEGARSSESWQALEAEMRRAYEDDMRSVKIANERETQEEEYSDHCFRVPSTGALLNLENACQHLEHFCAISVSTVFVDSRPQFEFSELQPGCITSEVRLPITIDSSVRKARSIKSWKTENMARKDAAFEAYKALYSAGLVNDNLLPIRQTANTEAHNSDRTPSMIEMSAIFDPWPSATAFQQSQPHVWYRTLLTLSALEEEAISVILLTPVPLPPGGPCITLHWNQTKVYNVHASGLPTASIVLTENDVRTLRSTTWQILHSIFHGRMQREKDDFLWLLAPCDSAGCMLGGAALTNFETTIQGQQSLSSLVHSGQFNPSACGLISTYGDSRKFILNTEASNYSARSEFPTVWVNPVPKRRDFLHPVLEVLGQSAPRNKAEPLALSECVVDNLPAQYSLFALLFPPVLHKLELNLIAETLRTTTLVPVSFDSSDLPVLIRALTSSSANGKENYQRLEFLGDCILKFIASLHLMAANLKEPESFLTQKKGNIVSNGSLARAAMSARIDQYIISKPFTGAKWKPRLLREISTDPPVPNKVQLSSKLAADVIESLIGASFVVGGFSKAILCIQTLLPLERWTPMPEAISILYENAQDGNMIKGLSLLEGLVGYTFRKKMLLLDATTHPSYIGPNVNCSYQRLEFLGDAVLDFIVTKKLYEYTPVISHQTMHGIRTAMVNASFLAFKMFEATVEEDIVNKKTMKTESQSRALWQFLRYGGPQVNAVREVAMGQHNEAREHIKNALERDRRFPWALLAFTDPPKFLSDMIESVLGAIYTDSCGDISTCEAFVRRLGILDCLERILRDGVDCLHPKERLGHLAGERDVKYIYVKSKEGDVVASANKYRCQVMVGGEKVGGTVGGLKRLNAETIAASLASQILETKVDISMSEEGGEDAFFDADDGGDALLGN